MKPMQSKRERNPSPAGQPPRVGMLRLLGNISDAFIRAALLVTLASFSAQSWGEPLGRLFSTPDERADLERQAREAEDGMRAKSAEFMEKGGEIYLSADGRKREAID